MFTPCPENRALAQGGRTGQDDKKQVTAIPKFSCNWKLGPVFLGSYRLLSARWSQNLHFEAPSNQLLAKGSTVFGLPLTSYKIATNSSLARYWQISYPLCWAISRASGQFIILKAKAISYLNKRRDSCILVPTSILSVTFVNSFKLSLRWNNTKSSPVCNKYQYDHFS